MIDVIRLIVVLLLCSLPQQCSEQTPTKHIVLTDSTRQVVQTVPLPDLNLFQQTWMVYNDNARNPCHIKSTHNRKVMRIGLQCHADGEINRDFYTQFVNVHTTLPNYHGSVMYFQFSFQFTIPQDSMNMYKHVCAILQQFNATIPLLRFRVGHADYSFIFQALQVDQAHYNIQRNMGVSTKEQLGVADPISIELSSRGFLEVLHSFVRSPNADPQHVFECEQFVRSFYITIEDASLSYLMQPSKMDLHSPALQTARQRQLEAIEEARQLRDTCELLGASCAVVLKRLQVEEGLYPGGSRDPSASPRSSTETAVDAVGDVQTSTTTTSSTAPLPRVFCGIFTTERNHDSKVRGIVETWGRKCTALLAFSTVDDASIPSIALPHLGEESYYNMWQKTRSIWMYIAKHYVDDYDWFLLGGDDMYYVMENLYAYLMSEEMVRRARSNDGTYLGRVLHGRHIRPKLDVEIVYNSGGPGYILNAAAVQILVGNLPYDHCFPMSQDSSEDSFIGVCLADSMQSTTPYNTTDALGRELFHVFPAGLEFEYTALPAWIHEQHWFSKFAKNIRPGYDCCSEYSVSFHFLTATAMYLMDDFIYHCPHARINEYYKAFGNEYFDKRLYNLQPETQQQTQSI